MLLEFSTNMNDFGSCKMRTLRFIFEFLKYPKQVGTFTQSSKALAKKMAEEVNGSFKVIEFGAGTGSVTSEILKQLPENGKLTCFEINPVFCKHLKKINDSRLTIINDDASKCEQYVDGLDCIVSGLPLTLFDKSQKERILAITSRSKTYIQLQYSPLMSRKMKRYFTDVKLKFVPQNFPPAFVYVCKSD
jgi:phospholipid N-methyltransferase